MHDGDAADNVVVRAARGRCVDVLALALLLVFVFVLSLAIILEVALAVVFILVSRVLVLRLGSA